MRRFMLRRDEDVNETSGVGYVAEGLEFWDLTCCMHWRTPINSTTVYRSVEDLLAIHSHDGKSTIEWIDEAHTHLAPILESSQEQAPRKLCKADGCLGMSCGTLAAKDSDYCRYHQPGVYK